MPYVYGDPLYPGAVTTDDAVSVVLESGIMTPVNLSYLGYLVGHEGWGMPPITRYEEAGPLQDGSTDRGYRIEPRIGKFVFNFGMTTKSDLYYKREEVRRYFSPGTLLKIRFTVGTTVKEILGYYYGDMDLGYEAGMWGAQKFVVSVKCGDPTFYNPVSEYIWIGGGGGTGLVIPLVLPFNIGSSVIDTTLVASNNGDADEYPYITLTGPITSPVIRNVTYGWKLDFTGITINAGVTYEINLKYGYKTVKQLPSTNKLSELSNDSDLSSFRIKPGDNDIKLTGTGTTSATLFMLRYNDRYLGV